MPARNRPPATAPAADATDLNDKPINVIHDRLGQAHALLDLLYTMTTIGDCADEHIETLCKQTLSTSLHSAMLRIEEAKEAADRWFHE